MKLNTYCDFMTKSVLASKILGTLMGLTVMGPILTCCSGIGIGLGTNVPSDVSPTNLPMAQGFFTGQNGKTVTGNALVFSTGLPNFILRLEGITTPAELGLQIQLVGSDGQTNFALRAYGGNQNYTFTSANPGVVFSRVYIHSTLTNMPYGTAILK
ncbi:MAG: hypothetical protein ABIQ95_05650 [Bdellovibrionia bacterium]